MVRRLTRGELCHPEVLSRPDGVCCDCYGAGRKIDCWVECESEGHGKQTSHAQELSRTAGSLVPPREDMGAEASADSSFHGSVGSHDGLDWEHWAVQVQGGLFWQLTWTTFGGLGTPGQEDLW